MNVAYHLFFLLRHVMHPVFLRCTGGRRTFLRFRAGDSTPFDIDVT